MQTFVPYNDLYKIGKSLDNKRLGKQRVEVLQILNALAGKSKGWVNHPATKMWRNHEQTLISYGSWICTEWCNRGFKDTCHQKILDMRSQFDQGRDAWDYPSWWGDMEVHESHRSNLLRKMPEHYSRFGWDIEDSLPYKWSSCFCQRCILKRYRGFDVQ